MPLLNDEEIDARLTGRPGWERRGDAIVRELQTEDFVGSVDLLNRITPLAEEMSHHPDVSISWNRLTLTLSTHAEGGLTDSDFELARRIDELA